MAVPEHSGHRLFHGQKTVIPYPFIVISSEEKGISSEVMYISSEEICILSEEKAFSSEHTQKQGEKGRF